MKAKRKRFYMGYANGGRWLFSSATTPTAETHSAYNAVIGPFRTKKGAEYMRDHGEGNPHCRTVSDAERLAREASSPAPTSAGVPVHSLTREAVALVR